MNQQMLALRLGQAAATLGDPMDEVRLKGYLAELTDLLPQDCIDGLTLLMQDAQRRFLPAPGEIRASAHAIRRSAHLRDESRALLEERTPISDEEREIGIRHIDEFKSRMGWI